MYSIHSSSVIWILGVIRTESSVPLERMLSQLSAAGLEQATADQVISEAEKRKLLQHLQNRHGQSKSSDLVFLRFESLGHPIIMLNTTFIVQAGKVSSMNDPLPISQC